MLKPILINLGLICTHPFQYNPLRRHTKTMAYTNRGIDVSVVDLNYPMDTATGTIITSSLPSDGTLPSDGKKQRDSCMQAIKAGIKKNMLLVLSIIGIVVGFTMGFAIRPLHPSADAIMWIGRH